MDMMNSIAATATALSAAQLQQSYSLSVTKKAMENQELAAQAITEMLPQAQPGQGSIIDVYA